MDLSYDTRLRPPQRIGGVDVLAVEELAADKVLAVFGRAAARDFVDLDVLVGRLGWPRLLRLAAQKDLGFDHARFLEAVRAFDRLTPDDFNDPQQHQELRDRVSGWEQQLTRGAGREHGWWPGPVEVPRLAWVTARALIPQLTSATACRASPATPFRGPSSAH